MPRYEFLKGKSSEFKEFPDMQSAAKHAQEIGAPIFMLAQEDV